MYFVIWLLVTPDHLLAQFEERHSVITELKEADRTIAAIEQRLVELYKKGPHQKEIIAAVVDESRERRTTFKVLGGHAYLTRQMETSRFPQSCEHVLKGSEQFIAMNIKAARGFRDRRMSTLVTELMESFQEVNGLLGIEFKKPRTQAPVPKTDLREAVERVRQLQLELAAMHDRAFNEPQWQVIPIWSINSIMESLEVLVNYQADILEKKAPFFRNSCKLVQSHSESLLEYLDAASSSASKNKKLSAKLDAFAEAYRKVDTVLKKLSS